MTDYGLQVLDAAGNVVFDTTSRNARWHGQVSVPANGSLQLDIGLPAGAQGVAVVIPSFSTARLPEVGFNGSTLVVSPYVMGSGDHYYDTAAVTVIYGSW